MISGSKNLHSFIQISDYVNGLSLNVLIIQLSPILSPYLLSIFPQITRRRLSSDIKNKTEKKGRWRFTCCFPKARASHVYSEGSRRGVPAAEKTSHFSSAVTLQEDDSRHDSSATSISAWTVVLSWQWSKKKRRRKRQREIKVTREPQTSLMSSVGLMLFYKQQTLILVPETGDTDELQTVLPGVR